VRAIAQAAILTATLFIPFGALGDSSASRGEKRMLVLDVEGDLVDGPELISMLDAYLKNTRVVTELIKVEPVPANSEEWINLALGIGSDRGAAASLWIEPGEQAAEGNSVLLVILAQRSESKIVLPIEIDNDDKNRLFRKLAAAARTILDTELLDELGSESPKDQEPPQVEEEPLDEAPREPEDSSLKLGFKIGYLGEIETRDVSYFQGGTAGVRLEILSLLGVGLGVGYLTSTEKSLVNINARLQRIPIRLGAQSFLRIKHVAITLELFLTTQVVWLDASTTGADRHETDAYTRLENGGGVEAGVEIPLGKKFGIFFDIAALGMILSRKYEYQNDIIFPANPFRVWLTAGFFFSENFF
jgi:hypothetical protein